MQNSQPVRETFKKAEKLCNEKIIESLFKDNSTGKVKNYPFLVLWRKQSLKSNFPAQVLFVVSKRYFKSAVQRNRIKRRLRELYRKNKSLLYELVNSSGIQIALALIYVPKEEMPMEKLEPQFVELIEKFKKHIIGTC